MNMTPNDSIERLLELAETTTTPAILRSRLSEAAEIDSPEFEVRSNRLWSASSSGTTILLLTLNTPSNERTVLAAPVTLEPGLEDEECVLLEASTNELGLPLTVWLGLARKVPLRTLERPLGEISTVLAHTNGGVIESGPFLRLSAGVHVGRENFGSTWPSAEKHAELEDLLDEWMEELEPLPSQPSNVQVKQQEVKPSLAQVMDALNVPQRQAMNIVRGRHPLTDDEAQRLAAHIGSTHEAISAMAEPLPTELLLEMEQPRWKNLVRSEQQSKKSNEIQARLSLAQQAFALAARQSGEGTDAWRQRLRTVALGHTTRSTSSKE